MRDPRRRRLTLRTTHRSLMLLGGRRRALPLSGSVHSMTIVNPGTSRQRRLVYQCNPTGTRVAAVCRNVGGVLPRTSIICGGKYSVVSPRFPRDRILRFPGTTRRTRVVRRTVRTTGKTRIAMVMLKKGRLAMERSESHASLSLPNERGRLLGGVYRLNGPIMLMVVSKHTSSVGFTTARIPTVVRT